MLQDSKIKKIYNAKSDFYRNLISTSYKYNDYRLNEYRYYMYVTFLRLFIKTKKNSFQKKITTIKHTSLIHIFLRKIIFCGNKLRSLIVINNLVNNFYYFYVQPSPTFLEKYPTYPAFVNFLKINRQFLHIDFVLEMISSLNEAMFDFTVVRLNKRTKKKRKAKYDYELNYISPNKRYANFIKNLVSLSNDYNFYTFSDRVVSAFFDTFYFQKNSELFRRKLYVYKLILKKKSSSLDFSLKN